MVESTEATVKSSDHSDPATQDRNTGPASQARFPFTSACPWPPAHSRTAVPTPTVLSCVSRCPRAPRETGKHEARGRPRSSHSNRIKVWRGRRGVGLSPNRGELSSPRGQEWGPVGRTPASPAPGTPGTGGKNPALLPRVHRRWGHGLRPGPNSAAFPDAQGPAATLCLSPWATERSGWAPTALTAQPHTHPGTAAPLWGRRP